MRQFAIGDIHGCLTALQVLDNELAFGDGDTVVTLGDYVDRGPDSRGVIEFLLGLRKCCNLVALRGNHEIMMLRARDDRSLLRCGDGSLYTGIANNVERRFGEHVSQGPKAAKYLRGRLPLEIVYRKEIGSRSEASKEELRIKRMRVNTKVELVNGG